MRRGEDAVLGRILNKRQTDERGESGIFGPRESEPWAQSRTLIEEERCERPL